MRRAVFIFLVLLTTRPAFADSDLFRSQISTLILMRELKLDAAAPTTILQMQVTHEGAFDWADVTLQNDAVKPIKILLKGPHGFLENKYHKQYRSFFLASGFFTGRDSVKLLGDIPNTILVGFEYPFGADDFKTNPASFVQFIRQTPADIALALRWISQQSWQKPHAMIVSGVSLGGFFLPISLQMAQVLGVQVDKIIFICTGAAVEPAIAWNLREKMGPQNSEILAHNFANLLTLQDPQFHLAELHGDFLVIRADHDNTIPAATTEDLFQLLNGPKAEAVVHGDHINTDQPLVIQQVQKVIFDWLNQP